MSLWQLPFAAGLTAAIALLVLRRIAPHLSLVDKPGRHGSHRTPIPLVGGLSVLLGLGLPLIPSILNHPPSSDFTRRALLILGSSLVMFAVGFWDDLRDLSVGTKLGVQILVLGVLVSLGLRIPIIEIPFLNEVPIGVLAVPLTILWGLAVCNAINFVDGQDGLAISIVLTITVTLTGLAWQLGDTLLLSVGLSLSGALAAALCFNWPPASVYLGNAGSFGLGILLAVATLLAGKVMETRGAWELQTNRLVRYQILFLVLPFGYPLLELGLSLARRALVGKPVTLADRDHLHHRLSRQGWENSGILAVATLISALGGSASLLVGRGYDGAAAALLAGQSFLLANIFYAGGYSELLDRRRRRARMSAARLTHHIGVGYQLKVELTNSPEQLLRLIEEMCLEMGVSHLELLLRNHLHRWEIRFQQSRDSEAREGNPPLTAESDRSVVESERAYCVFLLPGSRNANHDLRLAMSNFLSKALARLESFSELPPSQLSDHSAVTVWGLISGSAGNPGIELGRLRVRLLTGEPEHDRRRWMTS